MGTEIDARDESGWHRCRLTRFDCALAVFFFAAAFGARWPFIARGETLLQRDECVVGLMAQDIAAGRAAPIYFYGQRYMGALEAYVIAALLPWFADPTVALHVGPGLFFGLFVALQYLMVTRWFGRLGGATAALALLAAAPMFVLWSIAARGAYIEIFVWGTLFWWAYGEWFLQNPKSEIPSRANLMRLFLLGVLVGSGFWINPMMLAFVAPVVLHALVRQPALGAIAPRLERLVGGLPLVLPALAVLGVLLLNCIWSVSVEDDGVHMTLLLGLVPKRVAAIILAAAAALGAVLLLRQRTLLSYLRGRLPATGPFLFGALLGHAPAICYVVRHTLTRTPLDDSIALGVRPIWTVAEPVVYLRHGLPLLLGADPRPFVSLAQVGSDPTARPPVLPFCGTETGAVLTILNIVVGVGLMLGLVLLLVRHRGELGSLLRLRPGVYSPPVFLLLALAILTAMYLLNGSLVDFFSIRYLLLLWAIVPGLLASIVADCGFREPGPKNPRFAIRDPQSAIAVGAVLLAWSLGQLALFRQVGPRLALEPVARALEKSGVETAMADLLDAHVLAYLTRQRVTIGEFRPFWPRLIHNRDDFPPDVARAYVVLATETDASADWRRRGFPGPAPAERSLHAALKKRLAEHPEQLLSRRPLSGSYQLWTLSVPLDERAEVQTVK